jgi:hypothetical protein
MTASTLRSVFFSCSMPVATVTVRLVKVKPASAWGFSVSRAACNARRSRPEPARRAWAKLVEMEAAMMPLPDMEPSEDRPASSPALGEVGPVTKRMALAPCSRASMAL